MGWVRSPQDEHQYQAVCVEILRRDDDWQHIGCVMRFYDEGPTYAHFYNVRIGAFGPHQAAKDAVEIARGVERDE